MNRQSAPVDGTSWSSALRTPRILWAALFASTLIYAFLILGGFVPRNGADPGLRWVFPGAALFTAILSFVLPGLVARSAPTLELATREELDRNAESMFRDAAATRRVVVDPADARAKYVARRQTMFIMGLAMSETPAIFALVAWMVSDLPLSLCLAMVAASAALIAIRFPLPSRWRADAEKQLGAVIPD